MSTSSSSSLLSVLHSLTMGSAASAFNKHAKVVSQTRARTDSIVTIPCEHIHSSLPSSSAVVAPETSEKESNKSNKHALSPSASTMSLQSVASSVSSSSSASSTTTGHCHCYNQDTLSNAEVEALFHKNYLLEKVLGRGASAEVYLARSLVTPAAGVAVPAEVEDAGKRYACKVIHRNNRMNDTQSMRQEVRIMKKLHHRNVITLKELYETEDHVWMMEELASEGELLQVLHHELGEKGVYNEKNIARLFKQLLEAVKYLHSQGIVHRDLKMDNLLCSKEGEGEYVVKVSDFGLSALTIKREVSLSPSTSIIDPHKRKQCKSLQVLTEMWGTSEYFAPEVYTRKGYGFQADIWSLGCLLVELLTGQLAFPYKERSVPLMDRVLLHGGRKPQRSFELINGWKSLSPLAKDLIKKMLKRDMNRRFDIDECLVHPWITTLTTNDRQGRGEVAVEECYLKELIHAKEEVKNRVIRKARRYDALVREIEREKAVQDVLSKLQ